MTYENADILGFGILDEKSPEVESPITIAEDEIDPRYKRTSYSTNLLLHACPRKFQLKQLNARKQDDLRTDITFAFGHAVGTGIQSVFIGKSYNEVCMDMLLAWSAGLLEENEKQKKSFAAALFAIDKLIEARSAGLLEGYEVAYFNGKPAAELSFRIHLGNGFYYRGYVDLVLVNKSLNEYMILENKTSSANYINHFDYKNSSQAIGYSVVLDKIAPGTSSYSVQYLIYLSKLLKWEPVEFPKTYEQRALWLRDILWDRHQVETLVSWNGNYGIFPMRGESCTSYGRTCEYMNECQLRTEHITRPPVESDLLDPKSDYDFEFDIEELLK